MAFIEPTVTEALEKARWALLEGDRDHVLRLLTTQPPLPEVLWLRAHAVADPTERLALLQRVATSGHGVYAPLAGEIVEREIKLAGDKEQSADGGWRRLGGRLGCNGH